MEQTGSQSGQQSCRYGCVANCRVAPQYRETPKDNQTGEGQRERQTDETRFQQQMQVAALAVCKFQRHLLLHIGPVNLRMTSNPGPGQREIGDGFQVGCPECLPATRQLAK